MEKMATLSRILSMAIAVTCVMGEPEHGPKAGGSEVTCSRSLVSGRDGLESGAAAPSAVFPWCRFCLGWFRHHPAQSLT